MESNLLLVISLWLIPAVYYFLWKLVRGSDKKNGKPKPNPDPQQHDLVVQQIGDRWSLFVKRETENEDSRLGELKGPLLVRPRDTITYSIAQNSGMKLHLQFPSTELFADFSGIDCWIPDPDGPLELQVAENRRNAGSYVYAIAVCPLDGSGNIRTPYVKGGSPPEIILEHE